MPTTLPGAQVTTGLPPLVKGSFPGGSVTKAPVPASWDDIRLVSAAVFAELDHGGKEAADAFLAWIEARRAAR